MKTFYTSGVALLFALSIILGGCAGTKKSKVDPYVGQWDYTFPTMDGGEMDAVMTITKAEEGYAGTLSSDMGSVDLNNLTIEEGQLSALFDIQGYEITMKGTFEGDQYNGTTMVDGNEFPMNATKRPVQAE